MFIRLFRENQRGVLFRLGKAIRVIGPGLVVTVPLVDSVCVVELDEILPGWQGIGKEEVERRVLTHVLNIPESDEDSSGANE